MKNYKVSDFRVVHGVKETGDPRIAYNIRSKDGRIDANVFWEPNNVEMRFIVYNTKTGDIIHSGGYKYPFANYQGGGVLPQPEIFIKSLIKAVKNKEYNDTIAYRKAHGYD